MISYLGILAGIDGGGCVCVVIGLHVSCDRDEFVTEYVVRWQTLGIPYIPRPGSVLYNVFRGGGGSGSDIFRTRAYLLNSRRATSEQCVERTGALARYPTAQDAGRLTLLIGTCGKRLARAVRFCGGGTQARRRAPPAKSLTATPVGPTTPPLIPRTAVFHRSPPPEPYYMYVYTRVCVSPSVRLTLPPPQISPPSIYIYIILYVCGLYIKYSWTAVYKV